MKIMRSQPEKTKCKAFWSRLYFSKAMQVLYLLLITLCIFSVLLNFLLQIAWEGSSYLLFLEVSICILIIAEISLRMYLQGSHYFCSLGNAVDLTITSLCIIGLILSLQVDIQEAFGNTACDTLLVLRNLVFLLRLIIVFKHQDDTQVTALNISLQNHEEELVTRRVSVSGIASKYKPTMDTLFEEEEDEEESVKTGPVWKGRILNT